MQWRRYAFHRLTIPPPLYIAALEDDTGGPFKVKKPSKRELGDINDRYRREDSGVKLTELQAMMANLVVFKRHTATLPDGVKHGAKVLWKQALCEVIEIDRKRTRMHGCPH